MHTCIYTVIEAMNGTVPRIRKEQDIVRILTRSAITTGVLYAFGAIDTRYIMFS